MNLYTMIFLIVLVVVVGETIRSFTKGKKAATANKEFHHINTRLDQIDDMMARLDKRVKNVETIATSKDFQLNKEFENLGKES